MQSRHARRRHGPTGNHVNSGHGSRKGTSDTTADRDEAARKSGSWSADILSALESARDKEARKSGSWSADILSALESARDKEARKSEWQLEGEESKAPVPRRAIDLDRSSESRNVENDQLAHPFKPASLLITIPVVALAAMALRPHDALIFLASAAFVWCASYRYLRIFRANGGKSWRLNALEVTRSLSVVLARRKYEIGGVILAGLLIFWPQLRGTCVNMASKMALSPSEVQSTIGLETLRLLQAEKDLQAISSADATGLKLLTFRPSIDESQSRELHFRLTGRVSEPELALAPEFTGVGFSKPPKSAITASAPSKVGAAINGLAISDTLLSGWVDGQSLTGALYWTFDFRNNTAEQQQARAQILLPHGATVSRVTAWVNGRAQEAAFGDTYATEDAFNWVVGGRRDPVLVSKSGDDRVLLQAFPVPPHGTMKVRIGLTTPIAMSSRRDGSISMPQIVESNFSTNTTYDLHLQSSLPLTVDQKNARLKHVNGDYILRANVRKADVDHFSVKLRRPTDFHEFATRATHSTDKSFIVQSLQSTHVPVRKLALVIDGSVSMKEQIREIADAVSQIPSTISLSILFADKDGSQKEHLVTGKDARLAVLSLTERSFAAGYDNTPALAEAQDIVGNDPGSAILWIHGPQPGVFAQSQFAFDSISQTPKSKTRFYDVPISGARNRVADRLCTIAKIEARPQIHTVARSVSLSSDLTKLFTELFAPESFQMMISKTTKLPDVPISTDAPVSNRLSTLWAFNQAQRLILSGDRRMAQILGETYRVVTDATSAVVLEQKSDYDQYGLHRDMYKSVRSDMGNHDGAVAVSPSVSRTQVFSRHDANVPILQGATNGTIGPQGADATFITGVNTAGTIRSIRVARIEQALNVVASFLLILGLAWGIPMIVAAFAGGYRDSREAVKGLKLGCATVTGALFLSVGISYLMMLAIDAHLFS